SGQPGLTEPPGPADLRRQLLSHSTQLDAQIREQGSSLQSLAGQLSSHTWNIANLDQLIWRLMARNMQLAQEIAESQQHIEEKRSAELRRLKHQVEYAGDAVKRQTKQVRSALVGYEPSQAPERAIENGHGDSDVRVDPAFLQREGALQNSYRELQLTSLTDATNALRKKSGAVGKAAKLMLDQGESFEAADVLTSCSLSQRALKKLVDSAAECRRGPAAGISTLMRSSLAISSCWTNSPPAGLVGNEGSWGELAAGIGEFLTISADEGMDLECHEEAPMVVINHHVGTGSQGGSVALSEEVRRLLESSDPDRPTVVLVQSLPSPLPGDGVASPVEAGSPPGGLPDDMRFRCSSIWLGSHKSAAGRYWVTVTGAGFEFPVRTVYSEWREVSLSLGVADVTEVLGHLSCNMAVLYVTTTPECARSLREKLGTSRNVPHYFDPGSTGKFLTGGAFL
ncbi:hypothetical protein HPB47_011440, partial [Ixodes persulcatus]